MMVDRVPGSGGFLLSWNRVTGESCQLELDGSRYRSACTAPACLWQAGVMGNRHSLAHRCGLPDAASAAEVGGALYEQLGREAWRLVSGDWAAVLWSAAAGELVLVRDRMGVHGLYYAEDGGRFWASNRLEALLDGIAGPHRPNRPALVAQMHASPPALGETAYEGIRCVGRGRFLRVGPFHTSPSCYWQALPQPLLRLSSDDEYAEAYSDVLFPVVEEYAHPGPAAVTLSSGLDSTSVSVVLSRAGQDLTAFTWVTPELPDADEGALAQQVADRLGLPWVPLRADLCWPLSGQDAPQTYRYTPHLGYYYEMWQRTFDVMKENGTAVAYDGVSGDNLFGGNVYPYADQLLRGHWIQALKGVQAHRARSQFRMGWTQALRRLMVSPLAAAYTPWIRRRPEPVSWLRPEWHEEHLALLRGGHRAWRLAPGRHQRRAAVQEPLLQQTLEQQGIIASERGVQLRHPLIDHRLVDFAVSLPTEQTLRAGERKLIMRRAMRDYLPRGVLDLKHKILPGAIAMRGLRERETGKVWPLLTDMRAAELGLVDEDELRSQYDRFVQGETDDARFWYTLTMEAWLRQHF